MKSVGVVTMLGLLAMMVAVPRARASDGFSVTSQDIRNGGRVARDFVYSGCGGANRSPELHWTSPPAETRGFAVTVFDPDARNGAGWWHWLLTGLPASQRRLPGGVSALPPPARQWPNDFGNARYDGPCPPPGDQPHRYRFTVYALDTERLDLPDDASPAQLRTALQRHALAQATLIARYGR